MKIPVLQYDMDEKLGFIRPNVCYVPDAIYNCAIMHSNDLSTNKSEPSNYKKILQSADFNGLNKRNKSFIRFVYAEAQYGRGHIRASDDEMILELINLVKSGKIEYLDEMLKPVKNQYYSASTHRPSGDKIKLFELGNEHRAWLFAAGQRILRQRECRLLREDSDAVLSALVVD